MLRIHFTGEDLARTQVAAVPDPLWEIVMSLQALRSRYGKLAFGGWRASAGAAIQHAGILGDIRLLAAVVPTIGYFPDFLTPAEGALGLDEGIEAILATPRRRLRDELGRLRAGGGHSPWIGDLMSGRGGALSTLGGALRAYHRTVLAPHWPQIETDVGAHWAVAARTRRVGGIGEMLAGLSPALRWKPPVLEADFGQDRDVRLAGRGIVLIPSYFHWNRPIPLADPELPPVLVYRIAHEPRPSRGGGDPLAGALGSGRAAVLRASEQGASTGDIARRCRISPAAASRHTALLRDAGLMASERRANTVVHTPTALGAALLLSAR